MSRDEQPTRHRALPAYARDRKGTFSQFHKCGIVVFIKMEGRHLDTDTITVADITPDNCTDLDLQAIRARTFELVDMCTGGGCSGEATLRAFADFKELTTMVAGDAGGGFTLATRAVQYMGGVVAARLGLARPVPQPDSP